MEQNVEKLLEPGYIPKFHQAIKKLLLHEVCMWVTPLLLFNSLFSNFQEQEVRLRNSMSNLRHRVGGKLEAMGDKLEAMEEKSKDFIHGFVGLFGRDGRIVSLASTHSYW